MLIFVPFLDADGVIISQRIFVVTSMLLTTRRLPGIAALFQVAARDTGMTALSVEWIY
jgi:hypothetical protein